MNEPAESKPGHRKTEQYVAINKIQKRWKRSMVAAHWRAQSQLLRETDDKERSAFHKAKDFLKIQVIQWIWHYIRNRFGRKHPFLDYRRLEGDKGIYDLAATPDISDPNRPVRISLVGDWASGTKDADNVAKKVEDDAPHFTIHLGDVYYVGTKKEIRENMLGERVQWPLGSHGSFALNANHEMYVRGKPYFKYLLPKLGIVGSQGQGASFFCLRNEHWLVIGLDTGYYSVGIPIVEKIIKTSAKLHSQLMKWLEKDVRLQDDHQRGIIFLSHHQYYSQFESGYNKPAKQLARLVDRPVLWFWGHEHRLAFYRRHATKKGRLQAYGRCVGHGGVPIEDIGDGPKSGRKYRVGLVLYDKRERRKISDTPVGYNGYANLVLEGRRLTIEYKDTEQLLVKESWEVDDRGVLTGTSIDLMVPDKDLRLHEGADIGDAIA
jgi:hypothetical protein